MLTVAEALDVIVAQVPRFEPVSLPLREALGLVLAEPAASDLDSPPFDKALMDGFAVRAADVATGRARLRVVGEVLAGQVPQREVGPGEAIRIMTGAPLPAGADAVVQVEHTRIVDGAAAAAVVDIETSPIQAGRSILRRGASLPAGTVVLPAGRQLRAQELGCLAELGRAWVTVYPRPRVAVLATGDELVPVDEVPGPGQIRNSNETMLVGQLIQAGAEPVPLGIARDNREDLERLISRGLQADMLLLSGGVSAGVLDLVPATLARLGVRQVFHKVRIKPGQPLYFGILDRTPPGATNSETLPAGSAGDPLPPPQGSCCLVFGLPGNPVSSMVCCELFAHTAIRRLMGVEPARPVPLPARFVGDRKYSADRPTYHPAHLEQATEGPTVQLVPWVGSADLCATAGANCMVLLPDGERHYRTGDVLDVFPWHA